MTSVPKAGQQDKGEAAVRAQLHGSSTGIVPIHVLRDARFQRHPAAALTLMAVASFPADKQTGWTYATQKSIAARAGQHVQHANKYLHLLVEIGALSFEMRPNPATKGRKLIGHYRIERKFAPSPDHFISEEASPMRAGKLPKLVTQDVTKSGELVTQDVTNPITYDVTKSGEFVTTESTPTMPDFLYPRRLNRVLM